MIKIFSLMTSFLFIGATILAQTPEFNITKLSHPDIRDYVYGFAEAADGSVYFFNGDDEVFVSRNDTIQPTGFNCPSFCRIQNISLDADGNLYVATTMDGLFRYNGEGQEMLLDDEVTSVAVAADGTIYAGTDDNGLAVWFDGAWFYLTKEQDGLPTNKVFQVAIDTAGTVWMASNEGLFSLANGQITAAPIPDELSSSFYQMVLGADGAVWVNAAFGGIGAYQNEEWTVFPDIFSSFGSTTRVAVSSTGVAWTSDNDGLVRVENGEATILPYEELGLGNGSIVRGLFMDSADRLWVSLDFSNDLAIVTEETVSGIFSPQLLSTSVQVAPNPAGERLQINWAEALPGVVADQLLLHNSIGQVMRSYSLDKGQLSQEVNVSDLAVGHYHFTLWNKRQILASGKVIVE